MEGKSANSYLFISVCAHGGLLLILMINAIFFSTKPVFENTNQNDVISAVVLGDSVNSKIIPQKITPAPTPPPPKKIEKIVEKAAPEQMKNVAVTEPPKKNVIALEKPKPEKIKKKLDKPKIDDKAIAGLLDDIEKTVKKNKKAQVKSKTKPEKHLASKFAKMLQTQAEETMRQAMLEEDIRVQGEQARFAQGEVDKYKALIIQAISEHWVIPVQSNRKLSSELMIRLSPGGMVLDVQITRSSGDPALDSSARAAVLKASPLPVPKDLEAFKAFKRFVLRVKPENIVNGA